MQNMMGQARAAASNVAEKAKEAMGGRKEATQQMGTQQASGQASGQPQQKIDMNTLAVKQDLARSRFSTMLPNNEEAYLDYKLNEAAKSLEITYIFVPAIYRDQGIASKLLTEMHTFAKAKGYQCSPSEEARPFTIEWHKANPQFQEHCKC